MKTLIRKPIPFNPRPKYLTLKVDEFLKRGGEIKKLKPQPAPKPKPAAKARDPKPDYKRRQLEIDQK